ncbi:hypothetical protein [Brachyspira aalborgi]|uniref:Cell surface protein n=1 Tax=Brachyspira aalborgi TaxID=29522 RepID=A0ABY3KCH2_9SPIR|nr:hypothetical protein [Brachyspira aalborgi]TXJ34589.1 hypothetical protein EPJ71_01655 [Brachyspira aalborgi]TXJ46059.1 hypothetical protein EPJ65_00850 [Brachyspira aalborgi]
MKKLLIILLFTLIPMSLFGFYGDGSGRSFIDFLMDKDQLRARTDQIGFLYGTEHIRVAFGVTGNTSGVILDNWTNDSSTNNKLSSYFRPSVALAVGYKSDLISVGGAYQFKYIDSNYMVHTPALMLTAMDNTLRLNIPVAIGVGNNFIKNTFIVSTAVEARYYLHKFIDYFSQLRLYFYYGYARMSYAKIISSAQAEGVDPNSKAIYKDQTSIGLDLRAYFNFPTDKGVSIEPYIRVLYSQALDTVENLNGTLNKYKGENFNITPYGFDYTSLSFDATGTEKLSGGYIASVPGIPNPQGRVPISGIYRIGIALPLGLRASNDFVSLYVEPSLSATIFGGKISLLGVERKGPFYTFGYVVYAELTVTPVKDLELFLELQTGGASRLGGDLYGAGATTMILNASSGIAWYF